MIPGILFICALLLAFSEKPHLFQRPYSIKKISIVSILIISAVFSIVKANVDDIQMDRAAKTIDSLQGESVYMSKLIDTLREENKQSQYEVRLAQVQSADSLQSYHLTTTKMLAEYNIKVDTLSGNMRKININSTPKEVFPTLQILQTPTLTQNAAGEKMIDCIFQSLNADAHVLSLIYITVNVVNGEMDENSVEVMESNSFNYTSIIPKGEIRPVAYFLDRARNKARADTSLFIVECFYKSKSNVIQSPVRKVYFVNLAESEQVREVPSNTHYRVSLLLKKKGIWTKFYDL